MSIVDRIRAALAGREGGRTDADAPVELWSPKLGEDYKSFWDNMARDRAGAYLAVAGEPFGKPATEESLSAHGKDTAAIIAQTLSIGQGDRVLEVGVGVGRIAEHVAPLCRSFTGTDISENMIKFARERLKHLDNVTLTARDVSDLAPFPDAGFDKIYFQVVLIHLDREDAFHYMREAFRTLAPAGLAWFQFYNLLHPRGFKEFRFAVDYMVEKGGKTRGRVHCYTASEVRELVTQAGFKLREDLSHLAEREQKFRFQVPDTDWEFYLIAVGERP
jgi:ubiquinone/menaquinone biosynthesis C-methylase UbiE